MRMILSQCQVTMTGTWRLILVVGLSWSSAAALPQPQAGAGEQPEHGAMMELGNIDNVGVTDNESFC